MHQAPSLTAPRASGAAVVVTHPARRGVVAALPVLGAWDHPNRLEAGELRGLGLSGARFGLSF